MQSVPSGLQGYVKEDTHLVGWETGAIMPFFDHIIEDVLNLFPVLYWNLLPGMLDGGD